MLYNPGRPERGKTKSIVFLPKKNSIDKRMRRLLKYNCLIQKKKPGTREEALNGIQLRALREDTHKKVFF